MTIQKLDKIIKDINKDNAPPNGWKESEFHENLKEDPLLLAEQRMLLNQQMEDN